ALRESMALASEIIWFEPSQFVRRRIQRDFPDSPIRFVPDDPSSPEDSVIAFFAALESLGLGQFDATDMAIIPSTAPNLDLRQRRLPASVHARLVHRF